MCGIVGIVVKTDTGFTQSTENAFYQMLWADTLRGDDSTGVCYVHNDASFGVIKDVGAATDVAPIIQNHSVMKDMWTKGKALIGHNRKKTVGAVSSETAHPFVVDNTFAMVHNGTLHNHTALAKTEVDSQALAIHLSSVLSHDYSKANFEEAVGKVFGAFAIAAYNQNTHSIYLTRNKERPLFFVDTPTCMMWASEGLMLLWIASRCGIDFGGKVPETLKEHELLTINLEDNSITREEYVPKKAYTPPATTTTYYGGTATHGVKPTPPTTTYHSKVTRSKLSKNAFKHIKRGNLGTRIEFYATDFVECEFPKTIFEGATEVFLIGDCEKFSFPCIVRGRFDLNDLPRLQYDVTDLYYSGTISDMTYESISGFVTIIVTDVKTSPVSKGITHEVPALTH